MNIGDIGCATSQCAFTHVPNVMPRDVIVRAVNVLVVLVVIINELRSYLPFKKFVTDRQTDRHTGVVIELLRN